MSKRRFISAYNCDSDEDYYAQFEDHEDESEPDDDDWDAWGDEQHPQDCDYWQSNCYGRG
ncbi:hypothetical protein FHQ28_05420 [Pasteurellaceae bacterium USgator11]|nr:hypothetical protein FHQ19_09375 [Pasteurellaceae bacterium UScroc12]TNG94755.1 hypothetical protein FHQ20_08160 [Pasteurellaceae bacterium USgator41]TNG97726.1 hypothetical protein FHQ24_09950 [Pasteurellaceae bacterium UScroc31]TNH01687.1 hypothetical protein FHQ28_05420 [Pasteurellaceae bacterium USgator11]